MIRSVDILLHSSMKCVGNQMSDQLVLPGVGVVTEGVMNSHRKKVTVDVGLERQEICQRDKMRRGRK